MPEEQSFFFILPAAYLSVADGHEVEFEPTLVYGMSDRFALELHAHFGGPELSSLEYEAVAPAFHLLLTPDRGLWHAGVSGEVELNEERRFEVRGIVAREQRGTNLTFNLIAEKVQKADSSLGYAVGLRRNVNRPLDLGLEALGNFDDDTHEALVGLYGQRSEGFAWRIGVGTNFGDTPVDFTVRFASILELTRHQW